MGSILAQHTMRLQGCHDSCSAILRLMRRPAGDLCASSLQFVEVEPIECHSTIVMGVPFVASDRLIVRVTRRHGTAGREWHDYGFPHMASYTHHLCTRCGDCWLVEVRAKWVN